MRLNINNKIYNFFTHVYMRCFTGDDCLLLFACRTAFRFTLAYWLMVRYCSSSTGQFQRKTYDKLLLNARIRKIYNNKLLKQIILLCNIDYRLQF